MAEGLLKKYLDPGKVTVTSAGTGGLTGYPASQHGIDVCRANGVDISRHRSSALNDEMIGRSNIILVMAEEHLRDILRYFPASHEKIYLLKKYPVQSDDIKYEDSVPDPMGGTYEEYVSIFEEIEKEIKRIIPELKQQLNIEENSHNQNR